MLSLFRDGPEFEQRKRTPFSPPKVTLAEPEAAYVARDLICAFVVYKLGWLIDSSSSTLVPRFGIPLIASVLIKWVLWILYWYAQGIILAGGAWDTVQPQLDQPCCRIFFAFGIDPKFLLTPFYSWRASHHAHHKATMSIERDENYVPRTRKDYGLPAESLAKLCDYHEIFEDTPIYTLLRI
ncbi:hypothetical protein B0H11DRAFT_1939881, partial [Mycena galericulata]